jgi:hypothetical protein
VPLDGPSIDLNLMTASGRGELLRAAGAGPWSSGCAQRGLYSSVAGTLHADGEPLAVAPNCLLWLRDAAARPLRFVPAVAAPAAAAWWLGYAPPA